MPNNKHDNKELLSIFLMGCLFVIIHGFALIVTTPFQKAGITPAFENPDNPVNIFFILIIMLIFTAIILLIAKFWRKKVIQYIILGAVGYTSFYAFFLPIFTLLFRNLNGLLILIIALICAIILIISLFKYPEWYVIDITCIIIGTSAIVIFGISLGVVLVLVLLILLAIYDAISVYKTKHMIDLADTVVDLKLPVLLVIPKVKGYSMIKEKRSLKEKLDEGGKRDAFFMGLGDIVMPGILVIAVYTYNPQAITVALGTMAGTLVGFAFLMRFVLTGRPQAGLPLLCGGAILGYLMTSLLFYGSLVGMSLPF
jgi:presenilin-like A22 family membrane protease